VLPDGTCKSYKLNGIYLMFVLAALVAVAEATDVFSLATIHRLFWPLFAVANVSAVVFSAYLFIVGRRRSRRPVRSPGRRREAWFGSELNPDLWGVDLKLFSYLPSLLGLWLINLSFAAEQWEDLGRLTTRMVLYQSFFTIYILSTFHFEHGMLQMWDVVAENFGWMLVWADYVLVPFFYSIGGWYVLRNAEPMHAAEAAALVALFAVGLWVFRGANEQKHRFKDDPQAKIWGRPAQEIGGKLLVSGFWGIGRKLNYTGELMVYLSWTICAGGESLVPYVLPLWLLVLLVHRAGRDEKRCQEKYGALWTEYSGRARFRMFPLLY